MDSFCNLTDSGRVLTKARIYLRRVEYFAIINYAIGCIYFKLSIYRPH